MNNIIDRGANLSADGKYRYLLTRAWAGYRRQTLFIMLNPSTADAKRDDATVRACVRLAKARGSSAVSIVNLFAYRATKPADLAAAAKAGEDVIGPDNDAVLSSTIYGTAMTGGVVVAAWGAPRGYLGDLVDQRVEQLEELLARLDVSLCHYGLTKSGQPRHPLYLPTAAPLQFWRKDLAA